MYIQCKCTGVVGDVVFHVRYMYMYIQCRYTGVVGVRVGVIIMFSSGWLATDYLIHFMWCG